MSTESNATFGLLVKVCQQHGISRTTAYKLASKGVIQTFNIGKRKYVMLKSIQSIPHVFSGLEGDAK